MNHADHILKCLAAGVPVTPQEIIEADKWAKWFADTYFKMGLRPEQFHHLERAGIDMSNFTKWDQKDMAQVYRKQEK